MNQPIFNFQFFSRSILLVLITMLFIKCGTDKADNLSKSKIEELKKINPEDLTFDQAYALTLSQWPVDFEQLEIPTRYGKAGILAAGPKEAEPLVLLHGMNASSSMWYPNIEALSKNHRVYAIDFLLEPGKSEKLNDINNTNDIVDWYYEIFDQLKLEKFSIIGASRGGWLTVNIALRNNDRINRLVLLSPAQTLIWIPPSTKFLSNIIYALSPRRKKLKDIMETMSFNADQINPYFVNQFFIASTKYEINKSIGNMRPFSDEELQSIKNPTLLLIGETDIINNEKSIDRAKSLMPNVQADIIKHTGHFLSVDQPEIINKRILEFLDNNKIYITAHP